jgi:diguanylate cyclase (GGDEF)-like protein
MLTAREEEERVLDAFSSGADDYVTKPFNPRILLARVQAGRRLIELQQQVELDKIERLKQVADMGLMTRKLRTAALTDFLTELPNRRYAMSRLEQEWVAAERLQRPLSVVLIDIDHFKRINDEYGHDVGDLVLKAVSDTLRARTRRGDVVCRLGGEEFLVINVNSDLLGAWQCAERLRSAVEQALIHAGDFEGRITISLGVAERKAGMKGPQWLLKQADAAVYEAKAAGRNTIRGENPPGAPVREAG